MVFHWGLSDRKSSQVSRTLLSILAVLNNAFVCIVSIRPSTSKSSSPFSNLLVTVPKAPITIGTIVNFIFHSFFQFSSKVEVLILLLTFFQFYSVRLGDPCVCQSPIGVYVLFSRTGAGLCIYHLFVWSNLNFFHISLWLTLPTQLCLVLYSFCANLLHSIIMWLIVLSCHRIVYIWYFVESYLFLLWYDWFLWRCFVLLLGEILFLS